MFKQKKNKTISATCLKIIKVLCKELRSIKNIGVWSTSRSYGLWDAVLVLRRKIIFENSATKVCLKQTNQKKAKHTKNLLIFNGST